MLKHKCLTMMTLLAGMCFIKMYSIVAKIAIAIVYYCNNFNIIPSSILVIYINENTDLVSIFY